MENMAYAVIIILYVIIGLMSAAGSVFISGKLFPAKTEQLFFALILIPIAAFYLVFTAYFGNDVAWRCECAGVIVFTVLGLLGIRMPLALIAGYLLHGLWDGYHEIHAHGGNDLFYTRKVTQTPMAYGVFCAVYDWCMAAYFCTRRKLWQEARSSNSRFGN